MIRLKPIPLLVTCLCLLAAPFPGRSQSEENKTPEAPDSTHTVTLRGDLPGQIFADIETSKGTIEARLDFERAPLTTMNFIGLAEGTLPFQGRPPGTPFYDGTTFHRVVKDFVIQGGDPLSADPAFPTDKLGDGGPGYSFPDEFDSHLRHDMAGVLSMANDGPDTNGSQFFITLREVNRLNYLHSAFGQVVRGMEVVNRIEVGDKILHVTIRRTAGVAPGNLVAADADQTGRRTRESSETAANAEKESPISDALPFKADAAAFDALKKATLARRHPAAPTGFVYLADDAKLLPDFRVKNFNSKLANYEHATGHRLAVRLLPEFKPESDGQSVGNAVKKIAAALDLPDSGDNALACYFAKPDGAWSLRLGEATYPALIGEPGSTDQLMANGVLHRRKTELLGPAQDLAKESKLKESVDAVIDTMILKLDDFAGQQPTPAP